MAGVNCLIDIWRINFDNDDRVGGAMSTGTLQYQNIPAYIQEQPQEQLLLQQGYEVTKTFTAKVVPGSLVIYERDEICPSQPLDFQYYGDRFRVVGVNFVGHNVRDPRSYILLSLTRSVRAHVRQ